MKAMAGRDTLTQAILAGLAALLLFWGLTDKFLWQDEAATAVLAERMLKFGRPLAYDGVNLVTIDYFATEDTGAIGQRTGDPKAAVAYYVQRGDLKPDTTWKWQPWGQFVLAAVSLRLLGYTTLAARLPFALAGVATVLLLYRLVRQYSGWLTASLAAVLLLSNGYWILHARQCRYYALSSFLLVATVMAYMRWQGKGRRSALVFLLAGWCWFQVDYGTVWPVFAVLFLDALLARRRSYREIAMVAVALAVALVPFLYYYELWGRGMQPVRSRQEIFYINLFNTNEYVVPIVLLMAVVLLLTWRWKLLKADERHLIAIACGVLLAVSLWVPVAAPEAFLRYVIMAAPLGSFLGAWLLARGCGPAVARFAWLGALVLVATPLLSLPARALVPSDDRYGTKLLWRSELPMLASEIFGSRPDPNRLTVEWLQRNSAPSDEILINYEDLPLEFYLPNPIRGGIPAFRAEDDTRIPPRFVVLRRSADFVHKPVFERELARYQWAEQPVKIPDLIWGNNPDPMMWEQYPDEMTYLYLARRVDGPKP
jgi:Dolichyl-phosphate-mannose-protein mannosyltransferase